MKALNVMRFLFTDNEAMTFVCQGMSGHYLANAINLTRTLAAPDRHFHQWTETALAQVRGRIINAAKRNYLHNDACNGTAL